MTLLNQHQAVGIVALSNGLSESQRQTIEQLEVVLAKLGLEMKWPASLFKKHSIYHATDQEWIFMRIIIFKLFLMFLVVI